MEGFRILHLGIILFLAQALSPGYTEESPCSPGFESDLLIFKVHRVHLHRGRRLGKVVFNDCSGRTRTLFDSADTRFQVDTDGTLKVKRRVSLHEGHKTFSISAWDSNSKKHTVAVKLELEPREDNKHAYQQTHELEVATPAQPEFAQAPLVLEFPKSSGGLKRRKRDWVIPPINFPENDRGPFPKEMAQIKSSNAKEIAITYSVTGPGADQPPVGLFTINRNSGWLYVTQPLDRERQDKYTLQVHSVGAGGQVVEDPMDIIINVIDMNDNKPVFTQNPFLGNIYEAAKPGTEFMKVTATDADQPGTDNSDLRYSIVSQEPKLPHDNMFAINPVTGAIRLSISGLDREKYPKYTLEIQVADERGDGAAVLGKAVITVTDSNTPQLGKDSAGGANENDITVCNKDPRPVVLHITDKDGAGLSAPFCLELMGTSGDHWTARMSNARDSIVLTFKPTEEQSDFTIPLKVSDSKGHHAQYTISAHVNEKNCEMESRQCAKP